MQLCIPHEENMIRLGMSLAKLLKGDEIIYLRGELGAGKTCLMSHQITISSELFPIAVFIKGPFTQAQGNS